MNDLKTLNGLVWRTLSGGCKVASIDDLKRWMISIIKKIREFYEKEDEYYKAKEERDDKIKKWKIKHHYNQYVDGYNEGIKRIEKKYEPIWRKANREGDKILESLGFSRFFEDFGGDSTCQMLGIFEEWLMIRFNITGADLK